MIFTIVDPMEAENCVEEISCDLTKPRIVPYNNTWKPHQNIVYWCNLKLAQEKGWLFYQTRSHAIVLFDTLPAVCIETVVCMKTRDELFQKVRLTPRAPRVVLTSNSLYKINKNRTQKHLVTNQADQNCLWKLGATQWITEFLVYLFLQLNSKIHIVKTKSNS